MAAVEAVGIGFRTCTMGGVCVDTDGGGGGSAAPLFHDIASWLLDHYNVPLSGDPGPMLMLEKQ